MKSLAEQKIRTVIRESLNIIFERKSEFRTKQENVKAVKNSRNLPEEYKEIALGLMKEYSKYHSDGRVSGLNLHPDLVKKIKDKNLHHGLGNRN